MAEGTPIGALAVRIGGDATGLIQALGDSDKALGKTQASFGTAVKAAAAFAGAAAAAGAAVFAMVQSVAKSADELGKLSQKVGISVESLSALKFAAQISDLSLEQLGLGLRQLSKNMQEAQMGTGDAAVAFRALKVQVEETRGKLRPTEEVLLQLADRFSKMEDGAGKTALAMRLFGKSGADLIPLLNQGRSGIEALRKEAERLGIVISTETARQAEEFNDNMKRLEASSQALAIQLAGPLVKALGEAAGAMVEARKRGEGFFGTMIEGTQRLLTGSDLDKWSKEFLTASDRLDDAKIALANVKRQAEQSGGTPFDTEQVQRFEKEVQKAQAEVDRLQKIKKIMFPEENEPAKPGAPKSKAPSLEGLSDAQKEARARQIQAQFEEEQKLQEEALKVTADFRDKELEKEKENQDARIKALIEFYDRQQEAHLAWSKTEIEITEQTQTEGQRIAKLGYANQTKAVLGNLEAMTAGVSQKSRAMFEVNKAASLANAVVKGYESIVSSYAFGAEIGGPYMGAAMAAIAAVATAAQISAISSTRFGGGSGNFAPSIAGTTAATPVSPVQTPAPSTQGPRQTTVINLRGQVFGREQIRELIEQLNENGRDGGRIVLQ